MHNIIFPKQVIDTLKDVYGIEEADALSEIEFSITQIDKNTGKKVFTIIHYDVEGSDDTFEIYIYNNNYFIDYLGDETSFNFIESYDFDDKSKEVFSSHLEEIIL